MQGEFSSEDFFSCSLGGGGRYFSVPSMKEHRRGKVIKTMKTIYLHRLHRFDFTASLLHDRKTPSRQHPSFGAPDLVPTGQRSLEYQESLEDEVSQKSQGEFENP